MPPRVCGGGSAGGSGSAQSLSPHCSCAEGRVTASFLFIVRGAIPLGAFVGGLLGEHASVAPMFIGAGVGLLLSTAWLVLSPLRSLRELPTAV